MSASPQNAAVGSNPEPADPGISAQRETSTSRVTYAPGHEALQALLAFSSLHEQIRQRKARENLYDRQASEDVWELEQFVLDEVLQLVAERALTITGADGVAIALAQDNAIVCRASAGTIAPDAGMRLDPKSGFSGASFRTGRIVRCDDTETDPRVNVQACRRLGARSMVAVPLAGQQNVIGLLEAFSREPYGFNDSDVRSLNLLAELILAAMKPEEENRMAEISQRVVNRDPEPITEDVAASLPKPLAAEAAVAPDFPTDMAPATSPQISRADHAKPGLRVAVLLIAIAIAIGGGLWWKIGRSSGAQRSEQVTPAVSANGSSAAGQTNQATENDSSSSSELSSPLREKLSVLPQVTGIQHTSSSNSSTVIISLQEQVQYEAHRLSDPERIYFDLHDTALAPGLFGKDIQINDAHLTRIRIAQPTPGITRVVLQTKTTADFSVRMESNPYRLVIDIGGSAKPESMERPDLSNLPSLSRPPQLSSLPEPAITSETPAVATAQKLRIVLDAGHGGWDMGTIGRKGLMEKDLVLDVVSRLGKLITERLGAEVLYTRQNDSYVALEKRAEIANMAQANLFVSIHANYSSYSSARGVETYYTDTYSSVKARTRGAGAPEELQSIDWTTVDIREKVEESRHFAAMVQRALYGMLAAKTPGIRDRGVKKASYVVLTGTSMPAILTEISFVSSPTDEDNLQSEVYRHQIAEALFKGIEQYTASHQVHLASTSAKTANR
jgi:N-acetylmuramoyl-L-alanine amidase/putative methionine-R-sulfoxide reductase with GAF domain